MSKRINQVIFLFLLSLVFNQKAFCINHPNAISAEQNKSVFEMKHKMKTQFQNIQNMNREMLSIETNIGIQNKKYLKTAEARIALEEALNSAKKNIDLDNLNLKKNYNETKSILMGIVINKLEKTEAPADLLARSVLIKNLQSRMIDLESLIKSNKENLASIDELVKRLDDSVQNEKELVSLMNELEDKKKEIKTNIVLENEVHRKAKSQFDEIKNKIAIEKESQKRIIKKNEIAPMQITEEVKIPSVENRGNLIGIADYKSPIMQNVGIEHNLKGVTFKFIGKNEVHATKAGKIVYTGALANYGNVVMIDHGNETRSVLLGQFDFVIKNGDSITDSQLIGHTKPSSSNGLGDGKIYFEVRKKNLAQNTYLLLDKKTLTSY